ncbi:MAG: hypothetical protein OHK0029_39590 [Armatimonadaceae bacterium]
MLFGFVGPTEVVVILIIALLVFGPQKLPEIGRQIGSAYRELNRMRGEVTRALDFDSYTQTDDEPYDMPYQKTSDTTYARGQLSDSSADNGEEYTYVSDSDYQRLHTALATVPPGPTPGPTVVPVTGEEQAGSETHFEPSPQVASAGQGTNGTASSLTATAPIEETVRQVSSVS